MGLVFRSVHNTRIERLWGDVKTQSSGRWCDFFNDLEESFGLDINNENHIWLLQVLFLPMLNDDLTAFRSAWNNHIVRRRGEEHRSPADLFIMGMYEHGARGYQLPPHEGDGPEQEAIQQAENAVGRPQRLNNVEVIPPELTDERLYLLRRLPTSLEEWQSRSTSAIWTEALVTCRTAYPDVF